uniref:RNA-binding protein PiwiB n=1 Tax=Platynereis dumerilii TaxID=6359 RepID=A0A3G8G7G1_PLADU|nr:RNA-binding protein PiwiB [Platynereis dumerilii]
MASNQPPTGYGRGGRGAALLMAMNAPVRKPGESPPPSDDEARKPKPMALGRGLRIQVPATTSPPAASPAVSSPAASSPAAPAMPIGLGRGLTLGRGLGRGLQAMAQPAAQPAAPSPPKAVSPPKPTQPISVTTAAPTVPMMLGRGRGLQMFAKPASPASPAPSVSSVQSAQSVPSSVQSVPGASGDAGGDRPRRSTWMERMADLKITDRVSMSGTKGDPVNLACNYIPITCKAGGVYQYAVSYQPPLDARNLRISLLYEVLGRDGVAFDGAVLVLPRELPEKVTVFETVRRSDSMPVKVIIKFVKVIPPAGCTQLYNIMLKDMMRKLRYCQVGRNYYNSHEPSQIPQHKLEVWPGYITSIEEFEGGLMLMVDVSHRLLRTETVYNLICDVTNKRRGGADMKTEIARAVIGQSVLTRYNNKTYRIDDIDWSQTPASTFSKDDKTQISYMEYYKVQYGKTIEDPNQPLLIHRPKEKDRRMARGKLPEVIALIPELCNLTGLSDDMKSNFSVMKDVGSHTRLTPPQRRISLHKFISDILNSQEARKELEVWGLQMENDLLQMRGRVFPPEKIIWGNNKQQSAGDRANFSNQIGRETLINPCELNEWVLICTKRDEPIVTRFLQMMLQESSKMGMRVARPRMGLLTNDNTATFLNEIRSNFRANQTQLVVTICPTSRDDRYNAIKKLCYVESPVASQVINTKTIRDDRKLRSVTQKVALQINAKLGGELWGLNIPGKGLMVCGIDVCHGPAGSRSSQLGFVASLNNGCTQWYSTTQKHHEGQEMADTLRICLTKALHQYHKRNHIMPERIIMFRDGVGDGALPVVAGHEVPQMEAVFPSIQEGYQPNFAFIVVQKRINQRIMAIQGRDYANPKPGTVVDSIITRKVWFDFFLVSQHVGQGTVSPTHFIVVHDKSGWSVDNLQRLSYKLTHLYYNWPGTVRVPAPCQYAHKLAYMVSQNLSGKDPAPEICDRLFYL